MPATAVTFSRELTERDAYRHELPDHPSAREALYWNLMLPEEELGLSMYVYLKATGEASSVMLGYGPQLGPAIAEHAEDVELEGSDLDDFRVGGLVVRQPEPHGVWEIEYEGEDLRLQMRYEALHEAFSYWRNPNGSPLAFTNGNRVEQAGAVEGTLWRDGREIAFSTTGGHDHSWGIRDWAGMLHYKWVHAQAGRDLAFHAAQVMWRGVSTVNGYVLRDGELAPLIDARFDATYEADAFTRTVELEMRDEAGRVTRARGERFAGAPFPFPGVELTEAGCRFEIEGQPGVGLVEMLWPEGYRDHLAETWPELAGS